MRRRISVAIQKRAKRDQNLPEINQLCVVYEISLINLSTKISVLLKKNMSVKDIADTINVHCSTVYRELKCSKGRHHYREHYCPKDAEHACDEFRK
ncbi:helix-turn-helix domain-containing protein [Hoylesella marshii]|uniref:helix-turn-helix domain-containing protein n=1 Tax=Hoylesella marshii TaxID=189722 RepID=UPI0009D6C679